MFAPLLLLLISLGGVTDPLPILAAAHAGPLEEEELAALRGLLGASERLQQWLRARAEDCPALARTVGNRIVRLLLEPVKLP